MARSARASLSTITPSLSTQRAPNAPGSFGDATAASVVTRTALLRSERERSYALHMGTEDDLNAWAKRLPHSPEWLRRERRKRLSNCLALVRRSQWC